MAGLYRGLKEMIEYTVKGCQQAMKNADKPAKWQPGLTKREEFIKAAMQGLCANPEYQGLADSIKIDAIAIADATLAEMERDQ